MIKLISVLMVAVCLTCVIATGNSQTMIKQKYLALGDSYTIGESVDSLLSFPIQLMVRLSHQGMELDPNIIAKTGWTTDELLEAIEHESPANDYDLVTLLIGVNNQYRGRNIENYDDEFEMLLNKAVGFAKGDKSRVIVLSIPDYGVTPFGQQKGQAQIGREIDAFNKVNKQISDRFGVRYINITEISREALQLRYLIAEDDLHPAGDMYGRWVDEMMPLVIEILKSE